MLTPTRFRLLFYPSILSCRVLYTRNFHIPRGTQNWVLANNQALSVPSSFRLSLVRFSVPELDPPSARCQHWPNSCDRCFSCPISGTTSPSFFSYSEISDISLSFDDRSLSLWTSLFRHVPDHRNSQKNTWKKIHLRCPLETRLFMNVKKQAQCETQYTMNQFQDI